ncbi:MAG: hypothetical protein LLF94_01850 [Chlamydiales bacterium]|nr:hypothetical protein [Chlamydiales bacterium]
MKYILIAIVALALFCSYYMCGPGFGNSTENVSSGFINYGKETLTSLTANGFVELDGTYLRKNLAVKGNLVSTKAHLQNVTVAGRASISDSVVEGNVDVHGFLDAAHTTFRRELVVTAHKVQFSDCHLDALFIKKPFWSFGQQVVELSGNTVCKGPITFEGKNGKVIVSGQARVFGSLHGAVVEKL